MAETRMIQKQLAGVQDLLTGIGEATQSRATGNKTITKINADQLQGALVVDTVEEMQALNVDKLIEKVCIVKDLNRGGTFIYDSTEVANDNQGTNFSGWIRQEPLLVDTITNLTYKLTVTSGELTIVEIV